MSISVHQTLPSDMKKPILVTELKKLGVKNIESLSLEEMRNKFTELKMPLFAGRQYLIRFFLF